MSVQAVQTVTMDDVLVAEERIRAHVFSPPLIRSWALERHLGLPESRRVWLRDYGWTPSGSFKLFGACNWMAARVPMLNGRPVACIPPVILHRGLPMPGCGLACG